MNNYDYEITTDIAAASINNNTVTGIDPNLLGGTTWIADPSYTWSGDGTYTIPTTTLSQQEIDELYRQIHGTLDNGRTRMGPSNDVSPILAEMLNDI